MERILYADDDPDIQEIVGEILVKEGYEVKVAKNGNEAVSLAKSYKPDLLVLDFLMPGLNGTEVCLALKKEPETKGIPIIMVTAYPDEKEKALSVGAVDFINKPVEKADLLLRVKSALKVRHIHNELQKIIAYINELEKE